MVGKYLEPLTVCFDMGWQRCSSGTSYNNMSGHAFLVGANSNKILRRIVYSKSCCTCVQWNKKGTSSPDDGEPPSTPDTSNEILGELQNDHKDHHCPHNFRGSSKSMEAHAAVACVTALFKTGIAYVFEIVGDDDSSVRANLRHSFQALIDAGIWANKKTCWPKKKKNYVKDHGKLPLTVPAIESYLADPAHRCKSFGKDLFKLAEKRGRELHFDKIDCARLKHNFSYWQRQNCNEPYEVFAKRFACVIQHHFGNHEFCNGAKEGGWCKYKDNKEMIAKSKQERRYHDKHEEPELYKAVLEIWQRFATDEMLKQCHHPFWCQKSESLNQMVAVFAPKDKHLSGSMSLADRVALVVIIDSIGYAQGLCEVMEEVGCSLPASTVEYLKRRDAKRKYDQIYHSSIERRRRRGAKQWEKIIESLRYRNRDKIDGIEYEPCIAVREDDVEEENADNHKSETTPADPPTAIAVPPKKRQK